MQNNTKPLHYDIKFGVDMEGFEFFGAETVEVFTAKPAGKIVMNSSGLDIISCSVFSGGKEIASSFRTIGEELVIEIKSKISGKASISLEFRGKLEDGLSGFYRSSYDTSDGKKYIATTHFEPSDARRAFPCFDRPDMKATFGISVEAGRKMNAISNMPAASETVEGKKKIFKFHKTPPMSTYLVYIGVGDFEFIESSACGVKIRIATLPGKSVHGKFALDCAKKFLGYYNDYFGIKYPLPKMDLIAIPDFAFGAMENWGAITFREIELLFDPRVNSSRRQRRIATVIAHEMAHMWFGDLVTMKWWDDLWLNESFATWMEYKAVDKFFPEWEMWKQFGDDITTEALELDALRSSHPIEARVKKPSEISELFDPISYNKGGSIIRMLEDFLGDGIFRKGMQEYMRKHKYGNASTNDLWGALGHSSCKDIKKMMSGWIKMTGYPVIEVSKKGDGLLLKQSRFLLDGSKTGSIWQVPIKVFGKVIIMDSHKKEIVFRGKLNEGQSGFYRVSYEKGALDQATVPRMDDIDRWGLQNDLFAMALSSRIDFDDYTDFVKSLGDEKDYMVSRNISQNLYETYLVSSGALAKKAQDFGIEFNSRVMKRLGWKPKPEENKNYSTIRSIAILSLARMGDSDTIRTSASMLEKSLKGKLRLHPDISGAVYSAGVLEGGKKMRDGIISFYRRTQSAEEKRRALVALGSFKNKEILKESLDFSISKDVRPQDTFVIILSIAGTPFGKDLVWPWLKDNWETLRGRYKGGAVKSLGTMIESVQTLSGKHVEDDIRHFFTTHSKEGIGMSVERSLEKIRINRKFIETNS